LPVPRSPLSVTRSGGLAARPKRSPQSVSSVSVTARCPRAASGGTGGVWPSMHLRRALPAAARTADGGVRLTCRRGAACTELEQLIAQLGGELEIHRRCRLAHLLLEHSLERLGVHDRVAARGLGHATILSIGRSRVGDSRDESNLIDALHHGRRRNIVHAVVFDL